jgi:hypothetical protein
MRKPERLKRVTFVRLKQRNASGIASRSTVAADKSPMRRVPLNNPFHERALLSRAEAIWSIV